MQNWGWLCKFWFSLLCNHLNSMFQKPQKCKIESLKFLNKCINILFSNTLDTNWRSQLNKCLFVLPFLWIQTQGYNDWTTQYQLSCIVVIFWWPFLNKCINIVSNTLDTNSRSQLNKCLYLLPFLWVQTQGYNDWTTVEHLVDNHQKIGGLRPPRPIHLL